MQEGGSSNASGSSSNASGSSSNASGSSTSRRAAAAAVTAAAPRHSAQPPCRKQRGQRTSWAARPDTARPPACSPRHATPRCTAPRRTSRHQQREPQRYPRGRTARAAEAARRACAWQRCRRAPPQPMQLRELAQLQGSCSARGGRCAVPRAAWGAWQQRQPACTCLAPCLAMQACSCAEWTRPGEQKGGQGRPCPRPPAGPPAHAEAQRPNPTEAPCRHVGRQHERVAAALELRQHPVALLLRLVAVQRQGRPAVGAQAVRRSAEGGGGLLSSRLPAPPATLGQLSSCKRHEALHAPPRTQAAMPRNKGPPFPAPTHLRVMLSQLRLVSQKIRTRALGSWPRMDLRCAMSLGYFSWSFTICRGVGVGGMMVGACHARRAGRVGASQAMPSSCKPRPRVTRPCWVANATDAWPGQPPLLLVLGVHPPPRPV
jgi:hypothetical protein